MRILNNNYNEFKLITLRTHEIIFTYLIVLCTSIIRPIILVSCEGWTVPFDMTNVLLILTINTTKLKYFFFLRESIFKGKLCSRSRSLSKKKVDLLTDSFMFRSSKSNLIIMFKTWKCG